MTTWWDENIGDTPSWGHSRDHPSRKWLASIVSPGERVLEIAFGTGKDYANLSKVGVVYRGYDQTQTFIDMCKRDYPEGDFRLGNVMDIPEPDRSWDTVLCRHLIVHVEDWKAAIREMYRVSKKRLIILMWRPPIPGETSPERKGGVVCWKFGLQDLRETLEDIVASNELYVMGEVIGRFWAIQISRGENESS